MTESEAKGFVQGKLDCMEKCDVFNKEDKHRNNECELCDYCYSQGNFGEQKEAFQMAIQALEKQTPMKVLHSYDDSIDENWCSCPICCSGLGWYHGKHYKYCMNCGQKLDWSDENE